MTVSRGPGGSLKPGCVFSAHSVFLGVACLFPRWLLGFFLGQFQVTCLDGN